MGEEQDQQWLVIEGVGRYTTWEHAEKVPSDQVATAADAASATFADEIRRGRVQVSVLDETEFEKRRGES